MEPRAAFRRAMLRWHREHGRAFPWRSTTDPYAVLIGDLLLQRTRGENVEKVYREVMGRWPDPLALSRARLATIKRVIAPLGLAKRAPIIKRLGAALVDLGEIPMDPQRLEELPGIGPYGAHAIPIFAAGKNLPLADWVIGRVLRRFFGLPADRRPNSDEGLWQCAGWLVEPGRARELWLGTLDFAAAVCRPDPKCDECPLAQACGFAQKNQVS